MTILHLSRRTLLVAGAVTVALALVVSMPQLLGSEVHRALGGLGAASPAWLWLAGAAFLGSLVCSAGAWRSALGLVGGRVDPFDAGARYGVGSLVNSLAPARLGDAVRIALFARALPGEDRLWTTGSVFAALGAARALVLAVLLVVASATGALPLWPVLLLGGLVAVAATLAFATRHRPAHSRVAHLLDAFRALGSSPRGGVRLVGWVALATVARLTAATAIAASLGVHTPLLAALIVVPALDLAGTIPLTPGNVGVTSGAVTMALQAHGVDLTTALASGIAFHAVETAVGLVYGLASALVLARFRSPSTRRWTVAAAGTLASIGLVAGFSASVFDTFA
ncbi:MAG: lysylphosphatidylglycerol synthase transmembrane domain-containing protein [Gaiellaceae bacterium]